MTASYETFQKHEASATGKKARVFGAGVSNGEPTVVDQAIDNVTQVLHENTETELSDDQLRVYPDHYYDQESGGKIPVFRPTLHEFEDFVRFVTAINHYGMDSGIVKVIPPKEWLDSLPNLDDALAGITVRHPISQHFFGSAGIFTQTNIEARRVYTLGEFRDVANENSHVGNKRKPTKRKRQTDGSKNDLHKEFTTDSSKTLESLKSEPTVASAVPETVGPTVDSSIQLLVPERLVHHQVNTERDSAKAATLSEDVKTSKTASASKDDQTQNQILNTPVVRLSETEHAPIQFLRGNIRTEQARGSQCSSTAIRSVTFPCTSSSPASSLSIQPISSRTQSPTVIHGRPIMGSATLPPMPIPPFESHFIHPPAETNLNSSHMHSLSNRVTSPHLVPLLPQHPQLSSPHFISGPHETTLPNTSQYPHQQPSQTAAQKLCQPLQNPQSIPPIHNNDAVDLPEGSYSLVQRDAIIHDQSTDIAAGIESMPHTTLIDQNSETIDTVPVMSETAKMDRKPTTIRVVCRPETTFPGERSLDVLVNSTPDSSMPMKLGKRDTLAASTPKRQDLKRSRVNDSDQSGIENKLSEVADDDVQYTVEECKKLERNYWRNISFTPPMYGADLPGSLWSASGPCTWNLEHLDNILQRIDKKLPGVNTPYLYFGMWKATFAWHVEDMDLYSINFLHFGAPKQWYAIPPNHHGRFETVAQGIFSQDFKKCSQFLRHKTSVLSPTVLANHSIPVNRLVQHPGEFVITFPFGYHSGYNLGYNCAESVNFALDSWVEIGKKSDSCDCKEDSVKIDVAAIFDCDDTEGDSDETISEYGHDGGEKRNFDRSDGADTNSDENEKRKQAVNLRRRELRRERKLAAARVIVQPENALEDHDAPNNLQPTVQGPSMKLKICLKNDTRPSCALCPDKTRPDDLVQAGDGIFAHCLCATFVTETKYIPENRDVPEGAEIIPASVVGLKDIPKPRWALKCSLCKSRLGACVQCFKGRCTRAFHVTCADRFGLYMAKEDRQDGLREVFCSQHDPKKLLEKRSKKEQAIAQTAASLAVGRVVYARCAGDGTGAYFEASVVEILHERKLCRLKFLDGSSWTVPFQDIVLEDPRTEEQIEIQNLAVIGAYESEKQRFSAPRRDSKTAVQRSVTS